MTIRKETPNQRFRVDSPQLTLPSLNMLSTTFSGVPSWFPSTSWLLLLLLLRLLLFPKRLRFENRSLNCFLAPRALSRLTTRRSMDNESGLSPF